MSNLFSKKYDRMIDLNVNPPPSSSTDKSTFKNLHLKIIIYDQ